MGKAIRIGRVFGVELLLDTSWLVIFALIVWTLTSVFAGWHPSWTSGTVFSVAVVTALSFFASVLLHELSHALTAKGFGLPVRDITLHLFGGVAKLEREPSTPGAELVIAAVGPIVSVLLGVAMLALAAFVTGAPASPHDAEEAAAFMSRLGPTTTLLVWLGPVNIAVGVFNLLPGFPMDGGRILRALLWKVTGSLATATRWTTAIGQGLGFALVAIGGLMALGVRVPFFGTGFVSGLWLGFIGMFVRGAAKRHQAFATITHALEGVTVGALMRREVGGVASTVSLSSLVHDWFIHRDDRVSPVFFGERYVGVVALADLVAIPKDEWEVRTAHDVMRGQATLPSITPSDPMIDALRKIAETGLAALPVIEEGELAGMLVESDIARWVALHGQRPDAPGVRPRYV